MAGSNKRFALWAVIGLVLAGGTARAFAPKPRLVESALVTAGPLRVVLREEGRTRVREKHTVFAPAAGKLARIAVEPGDEVAAGAVLAQVGPADPAPLDARARAETEARRAAAAAARRRALVAAAEKRAEQSFAARELDRTRRLVESGALPAHDLEAAEQQDRTKRQALESADLAVQIATHELALAEAPLSFAASPGRALAVIAPAPGRVLRVLTREGYVAAGTPLVELGDVDALEVVVDVLTPAAAQIAPGARVDLGRWGGAGTLPARVRRVEPSAFTKISALGVEEQRVPVIVDLGEPAALGDGFRVEAAITLWEATSVVKIPLGALFRDGDRWAVLVIEDGRARRRHVAVGHTGAEEAEVEHDLLPGDRVILYPGDDVAEGARVAPR